jgi:hypothetical protein
MHEFHASIFEQRLTEPGDVLQEVFPSSRFWNTFSAFGELSPAVLYSNVVQWLEIMPNSSLRIYILGDSALHQTIDEIWDCILIPHGSYHYVMLV